MNYERGKGVSWHDTAAKTRTWADQTREGIEAGRALSCSGAVIPAARGRWWLRQSLGYFVCLSVMCHRHKSRWGRRSTQGPACAASKYTELIQGAFPWIRSLVRPQPSPACGQSANLASGPALRLLLKFSVDAATASALALHLSGTWFPGRALSGTAGSAPCSHPRIHHTKHFSKVTAVYSSEGCNCRAEGTQLFLTKQAAWKQRVSSPQTVNRSWKGRPLPGMFIHIENLHKHTTCLSTWTQPYAPMNTHTLPSVCARVRMYPSASTRFLAGGSFCPCPTNSRH